VKRNRKRWGSWRTSIPSETFLPTQPPMGALCSGGDRWRVVLLLSDRLNFAKGHQNSLCLEQLDPLSPGLAAMPISPQHRMRGMIASRCIRVGCIRYRCSANGCFSLRRRGRVWPEHRAHASWMESLRPVFLTPHTRRPAYSTRSEPFRSCLRSCA